jgi:hypothetical protein
MAKIRERLAVALRPSTQVLPYHPEVHFQINYQKLLVRKHFEEEYEDGQYAAAWAIIRPRNKEEPEPSIAFDMDHANMFQTNMKPRVQVHVMQAYFVGPILLEMAELQGAKTDQFTAILGSLVASPLYEHVGAQQKVLARGMYHAVSNTPSDCPNQMMQVRSKVQRVLKESSWWKLKLLEHAKAASSLVVNHWACGFCPQNGTTTLNSRKFITNHAESR